MPLIAPHTDAQLVTMIALMNNQIKQGFVFKDNASMSSIQDTYYSDLLNK